MGWMLLLLLQLPTANTHKLATTQTTLVFNYLSAPVVDMTTAAAQTVANSNIVISVIAARRSFNHHKIMYHHHQHQQHQHQ